MMKMTYRLALTMILGGLLFACSDESGGSGDGGNSRDADQADQGASCSPKTPVALGKDFFKDISDKSGIRDQNFDPDPPKPIPINDHSRLAFADLNGDGFEDIVAHSLYPNPQKGIPFEHLIFLNKGDGTFENASDASGLRDVQAGFFVFGDVDNDGDLDCYAGLDIPLTGASSQILLNDGKGHFSPKDASGVEKAVGAANAVFGDFDADGKLDLFVGRGHTVYAAQDQLFLGQGDGTFAEHSERLGGNPERPSNGSVACDYVSVELGHNVLFENDGHGNFKNVAEARGFASLATGNYWLSSTGKGTTKEPGKDASNTMGSNGFGLACVDVDGDGDLDVWLTAISHANEGVYSRKWSDPTMLLINQGKTKGFSFINEYLTRKIPFNEGDVDGAAVDFDNDGRMDLSASRERKYEAAYSDNEQKGWFGLFHQKADGSFESVGLTSGINDLTAKEPYLRIKGAQNHAWADIDHDGDLDLLIGGRGTSNGRPNFLFENLIGSQNAWLAITLEGDGKTINRDAMGGRVTLRWSGKEGVLMRERQSSRGTYSAADGRALHFGLGDRGCGYTVEVRWPDGKVETFSSAQVPVDAYTTIRYGVGVVTEA